MGIGVSIFLIAVGAILAFAVHAAARGIDLNMVGVILMIVGGLGLFLSLMFWNTLFPTAAREDVIVEERDHRHVL
jgi:hypothetical protein